MPISFPTFNYGSGGNLISAAIGAGFARMNQDKAIQNQQFMNFTRQSWLEREREKQEAFTTQQRLAKQTEAQRVADTLYSRGVQTDLATGRTLGIGIMDTTPWLQENRENVETISLDLPFGLPSVETVSPTQVNLVRGQKPIADGITREDMPSYGPIMASRPLPVDETNFEIASATSVYPEIGAQMRAAADENGGRLSPNQLKPFRDSIKNRGDRETMDQRERSLELEAWKVSESVKSRKAGEESDYRYHYSPETGQIEPTSAAEVSSHAMIQEWLVQNPGRQTQRQIVGYLQSLTDRVDGTDVPRFNDNEIGRLSWDHINKKYYNTDPTPAMREAKDPKPLEVFNKEPPVLKAQEDWQSGNVQSLSNEFGNTMQISTNSNLDRMQGLDAETRLTALHGLGAVVQAASERHGGLGGSADAAIEALKSGQATGFEPLTLFELLAESSADVRSAASLLDQDQLNPTSIRRAIYDGLVARPMNANQYLPSPSVVDEMVFLSTMRGDFLDPEQLGSMNSKRHLLLYYQAAKIAQSGFTSPEYIRQQAPALYAYLYNLDEGEREELAYSSSDGPEVNQDELSDYFDYVLSSEGNTTQIQMMAMHPTQGGMIISDNEIIRNEVGPAVVSQFEANLNSGMTFQRMGEIALENTSRWDDRRNIMAPLQRNTLFTPSVTFPDTAAGKEWMLSSLRDEVEALEGDPRGQEQLNMFIAELEATETDDEFFSHALKRIDDKLLFLDTYYNYMWSQARGTGGSLNFDILARERGEDISKLWPDVPRTLFDDKEMGKRDWIELQRDLRREAERRTGEVYETGHIQP